MAFTIARRAGLQGSLWGLVFGATIAASATSYTSAFPSATARAQLAVTFEGNTAWEALFGTIRRVDTVAGYTAYKSGMFLIILGAIWGLLIATRLLRGEEDAGRWEIFLSGQTTRAGAALQAALGLGAGVLALWIPTAVLTAAAGASSEVSIGLGASVFFATSVVAASAMFMAIGMFVGELSATRHDANLIGAGVLAASYLIRMAADSDPVLAWLRWASPLGWIEELRALTGSRPFAFVPIVVLVVVARRPCSRRREAPGPGGERVRQPGHGEAPDLPARGPSGTDDPPHATGRRGLDRGARRDRPGVRAGRPGGRERAPRSAWPRGGHRAAGRRHRRSEVVPGIRVHRGGGLVAIAVAGQIAAVRNEEANGHLENLLVVRSRVGDGWWFGWGLGRARGAGEHVCRPRRMVGRLEPACRHRPGRTHGGGLNVVPPALFIFGIGALAFGVWPRAAIGVAYGLVVWSFLVETLAAMFDSNHWLRDTSPFLHMAPVPAADPN